MFQNEARKMNHQEVQEEDRRAKLPKNWEARKRQVDWEEEQETKKQVRIMSKRTFSIKESDQNGGTVCYSNSLCLSVKISHSDISSCL